ncbi:MAG TPA: hypothetical protein PKE12_09015 [Kiritimatiellia bacterium]|nr:hypothetical protein [Kiritimatiellia bacterium]
MLPQFVISIIAVLVVVAIAAFGFTTRGYFVHLALVFAPILVFLVNSPSTWLILVLGLSKSGLVFPGLPQGLQVVHVLMAGLLGLLLARMSIEKGIAARRGLSDFFLLLFLAVIFMTAYVRGFGLRAMGGDTWGGMAYVKILVTGGFLFLTRAMVLSERQFKKALFMMLGFATLPALAQIVFLASGGKIYHQYMFIEAYVGTLLVALDATLGGGPVRYHMLAGIANTVFMVGMILLAGRNFLSKAMIAFIILVTFVLTGMSGFRGQILYLLFMLVMIGTMLGGRFNFRRLVAVGALALLALLPLYLISSSLPAAMQRAISWLPGIDIRFDVRAEAMISTMSRMRIWEMAWMEVPRYLWIGKGFAVNPGDLMTMAARSDWALNAFLSHNYHSGPLSLLLDTGVFGVLAGVLFMVFSTIEMIRRLPEVQDHPLLQRAFIFFLAQHIYAVISYYVIFGDVRESFPAMFINLTIMHMLLNSARDSDRRARLALDQAAAAPKVPILKP